MLGDFCFLGQVSNLATLAQNFLPGLAVRTLCIVLTLLRLEEMKNRGTNLDFAISSPYKQCVFVLLG